MNWLKIVTFGLTGRRKAQLIITFKGTKVRRIFDLKEDSINIFREEKYNPKNIEDCVIKEGNNIYIANFSPFSNISREPVKLRWNQKIGKYLLWNETKTPVFVEGKPLQASGQHLNNTDHIQIGPMQVQIIY